MKFYDWDDGANYAAVTPLAGVWIEIDGSNHYNKYLRVTPLAGVWIEIKAH